MHFATKAKTIEHQYYNIFIFKINTVVDGIDVFVYIKNLNFTHVFLAVSQKYVNKRQ